MPLIGPDATRYLAVGYGVPVPRPFHLRWLLPRVCQNDLARWWWVWWLSWPVMTGSMIMWRVAAGDSWQQAVAAAAILAALPGILGPATSIPVQIDLPATATVLLGCGLAEVVHPVAGLVMFVVAACMSEKAPVIAALWMWAFWPLLAVIPVLVAARLIRTGPDPLGDKFQRIADHPVRAALEAHGGRWRDGWLMVAPWGVCLVGLVGADWRLMVVLFVAYAQLLLATDTVRLVQHVAGPPLVVAAVAMIPTIWLLPAVVVHAVWWQNPERA